jgi:hypothetical protein
MFERRTNMQSWIMTFLEEYIILEFLWKIKGVYSLCSRHHLMHVISKQCTSKLHDVVTFTLELKDKKENCIYFI